MGRRTLRNIRTVLKRVALTLALAGSLAACQSARQQPTRVAVAPPPQEVKPQLAPAPAEPAAPRPGAELNGRWLPTDRDTRGVYIAEFRNGAFVSRAPGSSDALAKGSYTVDGDRVSLTFVGAATQTRNTAQCERRGDASLYCVPSTGSPFNLQRA